MSDKKNSSIIIDEEKEEVLIIGTGFTITGKLSGEGAVIVAGTVDGDIDSKKVVVAQAGLVTGSVICSQIEVEGKISGTVNSYEVVVRKNGSIDGAIYCTILETDRGADITGEVHKASNKHRGSQSPSSFKDVTPSLFKINLPQDVKKAVLETRSNPQIVLVDGSPITPDWLSLDVETGMLTILRNQTFKQRHTSGIDIMVTIAVAGRKFDVQLPLGIIG
jgi:cytoskeletal protein CcmA (bactofilin family)